MFRNRKGKGATGILIQIAQSKGYDNVADYLKALQTKKGTDEFDEEGDEEVVEGDDEGDAQADAEEKPRKKKKGKKKKKAEVEYEVETVVSPSKPQAQNGGNGGGRGRQIIDDFRRKVRRVIRYNFYDIYPAELQ